MILYALHGMFSCLSSAAAELEAVKSEHTFMLQRYNIYTCISLQGSHKIYHKFPGLFQVIGVIFKGWKFWFSHDHIGRHNTKSAIIHNFIMSLCN